MKSNKYVPLKIHYKKNSAHYSTLPMTFLLAAVAFVNFTLILASVYIILDLFFGIKISFQNFIPSENKFVNKFLVIIIIFSCIVIGYALSLVFSRIIMILVKKLKNALTGLSEGNYKTRLYFNLKFPLLEHISQSFNNLANELEHTEMMSTDFMNNFSHEFKTPISSIQGFAKLLKNENLTESQRREYLDIIDDEAERLTKMSTSILNLTNVSNQKILTDAEKYNLSEQIRNCLLLFENAWSKKNLSLDLDFDEYFIEANKSLMKEVWINFFDNAVKYTPENGSIIVSIQRKEKNIIVSITNTGVEISAEDQPYIFNKFYQVEKTNSYRGLGVGLSIAKKIVELHGGKIHVASGNKKTAFIVSLPC